MRYDPNNCRRRVDRGPAAENEKECNKYREFWGGKSSLRRFRDGAIVESVVWGSSSSVHASLFPDELTYEIICHVLRRHLPLYCDQNGNSLVAPSMCYGEVLPRSSMKFTNTADKLPSSVMHRLPIEALDSLRQMLTSDLKDFPLAIDGLRGMHPSLRYTSYFPPVKHPILDMNKETLNQFAGKRVNRMVEPISVVASFGLSSKWPTNLDAIRSVKSALIVRLCQCLRNQFKVHRF